VQTFVEIGSAVRKIFPDKKNKNKQIENISRVAQLTLGARLIRERKELRSTVAVNDEVVYIFPVNVYNMLSTDVCRRT